MTNFSKYTCLVCKTQVLLKEESINLFMKDLEQFEKSILPHMEESDWNTLLEYKGLLTKKFITKYQKQLMTGLLSSKI